MIKAYLKYCWFGIKALWQLLALGIFITFAGLPLWGLEKNLGHRASNICSHSLSGIGWTTNAGGVFCLEIKANVAPTGDHPRGMKTPRSKLRGICLL